MDEDVLTEGGKITPKVNHNVIYGILALILIIAGLIYWQFTQTTTDATVVDPVPVSTIGDLPPNVAVEEEARPTEIVEDFGLAEVSTTFVSPLSVADAVDYYFTAIIAKGGAISSTMRTPEKEIIVATTSDGKPYVVYIGEKQGETVVTINVDPVQ